MSQSPLTLKGCEYSTISYKISRLLFFHSYHCISRYVTFIPSRSISGSSDQIRQRADQANLNEVDWQNFVALRIYQDLQGVELGGHTIKNIMYLARDGPVDASTKTDSLSYFVC